MQLRCDHLCVVMQALSNMYAIPAAGVLWRRFLMTDKLFTQRTLPLPALQCLVAFLAKGGRRQEGAHADDRNQASSTVRVCQMPLTSRQPPAKQRFLRSKS